MEDLPLEIGCQIVSYITEIRDISRLVQVSLGFRILASHTVQQVTTDKVRIVPLSFFHLLHRVTLVDLRILILVDEFTPTQIQGHFLISHPNQLAPLLNSCSGNLRISIMEPGGLTGIIIQDGKFITLTDKYNELTSQIRKIKPRLIPVALERFSLLKPRLRDFLLNTNLVKEDLIYFLVMTYAYQHNLYADGYINCDQKMRQWLEPDLGTYIALRPAFRLDRLNSKDLDCVIRESLIHRNIEPRLEDIIYLNVPTQISEELYYKTYEVAIQNFLRLRNTRGPDSQPSYFQ